MAATLFKLTQPDGLTRRITFHNQPTWPALAARIEALYAIPLDNVSVSYIDADNEQVTLSTQEELDDFYKTCHQPGQIIKFTVQDLASARLQRARTPHTSNARNTFGIGAFDIEDDWQNLPIPPISELGGIFAPTNPHAFVEVVDSDASTVANRQDGSHDRESAIHSSTHSSPGSPFIISLDKGKDRVMEDDDISSTGSVLDENAPPKPPVHVYDLSSLEQDNVAPFLPRSAADNAILPPPLIAAESTPKADTRTINTAEAGSVHTIKEVPSQEENVADPPLPSIEPEGASRPLPSLSDDIANLINTFGSVLGAHPELSEGIRNIMRNTSSGTYWQAHREFISRAAQDIVQETGRATENFRRETEDEAGRRVAEALGGIFRSISQTLGAPHASYSSDTSTPLADETVPRTESYNTQAAGNVLPETNSPYDREQPAHLGPPNFGSWMHRGASFGRWGQRVPHPPPFGPPRGPAGWHWEHMQRHVPAVPPPPPLPMPGSWQAGIPSPAPPPLPPASNAPPAANKPTAQELRAQVDAAKARYKAEKERYRQEREERRKERERKARTVALEAAAPVSFADTREPGGPPARPSTPPVIAVHGKGGKPTHEVVSVHRRHTLGHGLSRRQGHDREDPKSRAVNRISRRLTDMGFTENAYPDLLSKIKDQLPTDGILTKDAEDNIVTTLLEELLAMSPKPPMASASASKDFPGTWH